MTDLRPGALAPVRDALVARAHSAAAAIVAAASADARLRVDEASARGRRLLAAAREEGRRDAAELLRRERANAEGYARAQVLGARRVVFDALRTQSCAALRAMLTAPATRQSLEDLLLHRLDPRAAVSPSDDGGLVAETTNGDRIDASVSALVDAAVERLDLEALWDAP